MSYGQYSQDHFERRNPLADKPKTKRQKHVFPTYEIPHLWAHKTQDSARNSAGNMFFDGDTIYSYGHHFPMARHVETKRGKAILVNSTRYSVTTSSHQSAVRGAIPPGILVFEVPEVNCADNWQSNMRHDFNVAHYHAAIKSSIESAARARCDYSKRYKTERALELQKEATAYAAFFDLKETFEIPGIDDLEALRKKLAKEAAATAAVTKVENLERKARVEARKQEQLRLAELRKQTLPARIEAWRNGDRTTFDWDEQCTLGTMLRIRGEEVETSMGARVPADHALRAYRLLKLYRANGKTYQRNGHTIHLGNYAIDSLDEQGTLHAGCHHIKWEEVERIGEQLLQRVDNFQE
jgi:hypothetical protein